MASVGSKLFKKSLLVIILFYLNYHVVYNQFVQTDYQIDFERAEAVHDDKDNVQDLKIRTFKYNRTTTAVNASAVFTKDFNEEMRVQVQAFKFLSNEYRLFPLRFEFNFCDALRKNDFGLAGFLTCGNFSKCPLKQGRWVMCNWFPDPNRFPPRIPNGRYMVELFVIFQQTEIMDIKLYIQIKRTLV